MLTSEATLGAQAVDIIVVIDNSSSMTEEIVAVENNVNVNFAQILEASGVDYRVILLAKHGSAAADQSVCIRAPLSGTSCSPVPAKPASGARFFQYDLEIASRNSLRKILDTYSVSDVNNVAPGGWKSLLRPGSLKAFIEISDDGSGTSALAFETELFALTPLGTFGDAKSRRYTFHSIIGIEPNSPVSEPWQPTDPKKGKKCLTAAQPGPEYEDLSQRTGGLRFPVCETASYDAVFKAAAANVIASAELRCDFVPRPLPNGTYYQGSYVEYTPGTGGAPVYFTEATEAATCSDAKYLRDPDSNRITLCPAACDRVKADSTAKLAVAYACGGGGLE